MKEEIFQQIKIQARQYFRNARGSHDFDHTLRVCRLAERIAESENADREVVRFSAILHDTGRQEEDENHGRVCHAEIGARMAREMLDEYNLDASFISHVADCILSHRFRTGNKPRTIEAKALYDADKLDSIGAVGVGRAFLFAGEIRAGLHDKNIRVEETKPYTKDDTAYREYLVKLQYIKDRMLTGEGKKIAEERHRFMETFFRRLNDEVEGRL